MWLHQMSHKCQVSALTTAPSTGCDGCFTAGYTTFSLSCHFTAALSQLQGSNASVLLASEEMELSAKVGTLRNYQGTTKTGTASHLCTFVCVARDACAQNNGGCSVNAACKRTLPGRRDCVCHSGFSGDGLVCVGRFGFFHTFLLAES